MYAHKKSSSYYILIHNTKWSLSTNSVWQVKSQASCWFLDLYLSVEFRNGRIVRYEIFFILRVEKPSEISPWEKTTNEETDESWNIFFMKSQFWAGLGSRASTWKKVWGWLWATFAEYFFMFSWAKKNLKILKSCID